MNKEQKAAVVEEVAKDLREAEAVFAVDYRGISVKQSADLRAQLTDAGARFRVVKNRLTLRAADEAGAETLKEFFEGPTALAFVFAGGDAALTAKALAAFRREHGTPEFKGGAMAGDPLTAAEIEALSKLPARDVLYGRLVAMTASPITGLVRTLNAMISGLAAQLGQIQERGLVGGDRAEDEAAAEEGADEYVAEAEPESTTATEAEPEGEPAPDEPEEGGGDGGRSGDDSGGDDDSGSGGGEDEPEGGEDDSGGDEEPSGGSDDVAAAATDEAAEDDPTVSSPAEEAPGDPVAEAETGEQEQQEQQETSE